MARYLWLSLLAASIGQPGVAMVSVGPHAAKPEAELAASKSSHRDPPYLVDLEVPGYGAAVVAVPTPSRGAARPVVVAAHGAWDRPEWHCELWQRLVRGCAFVLCPRGRATLGYLPPDEQLFYFPDHLALAREVTHAMDALRT